MPEMCVGNVSHWYDGIHVMIVDPTAPIKKGDKVHVRGTTTDFETLVESMQYDHEEVDEAQTGQSVGIEIPRDAKVREGDEVYLVT